MLPTDPQVLGHGRTRWGTSGNKRNIIEEVLRSTWARKPTWQSKGDTRPRRRKCRVQRRAECGGATPRGRACDKLMNHLAAQRHLAKVLWATPPTGCKTDNIRLFLRLMITSRSPCCQLRSQRRRLEHPVDKTDAPPPASNAQAGRSACPVART